MGGLSGATQGAAFSFVAISFTFLAPLVAGGLAIFWFLFATIVIADILATIYVLTNINDQEVKNCYLGGLVMGLGLGGLFNIAAWIERIMSAIGLWIGGATDATTNQTACGV